MDWIQLNLDAYRIVAEIATKLREEIQQVLSKEHGVDWHDKALPKGMKEQLVARKERESEIAWHETEYQEIINYTSFDDLYQIIDKHAELFPNIVSLASNPALLTARFLELGVLTDKIAYTRAISEAELSYISSFHQRFLKALSEPRTPSKAKKKKDAPKDTSEDTEVEVVELEEEPTPEKQDDKEIGKQQEGSAKKAAAPPPAPDKQGAKQAQEPESSKGQPKGKTASQDKQAPAAPAETPEHSAKKLHQALEDSDVPVILKELYREVTTMADSVWTSDIVPRPYVWGEVSTSDWYSKSFAKLGLKPLSDFYEIMSQVDRRMDHGLNKSQLQELLQQLQFAQILLALRDMFQRHNV